MSKAAACSGPTQVLATSLPEGTNEAQGRLPDRTKENLVEMDAPVQIGELPVSEHLILHSRVPQLDTWSPDALSSTGTAVPASLGPRRRLWQLPKGGRGQKTDNRKEKQHR